MSKTHIRKDEDGLCEMMCGPGDDPNVGWWSIEMKEGTFLLSALRPVSREQVERMRGEWKKDVPLGYMCKSCGGLVVGQTNFCPNCGQPKTDEAVEMVMERWKEAVSNEA